MEPVMYPTMRRIGFQWQDWLQGGFVARHLRDLKHFKESDPESKRQETGRKLRAFLQHAAGTTAFYRGQRSGAGLSRFPVLKKAQIQKAPAEFLSSACGTDGLIKRETSGSYGTPLEVRFGKEKAARVNAELIHYNRLAGLDVGDRYLNITTNKKGPLERFLKNVVIINPSVMDGSWYETTIRQLQQHQNLVIVGFPSVLYGLAQKIEADGAPGGIRMKSVITIAEVAPATIRNVIGRAFQCPVFNRYATMETGVIGHSDGSSEELEINQASYVVEVLSMDADDPVEEGKEGRVLVTDLYSHAMPIIRYDTGDTARLVERNEHGAVRIRHPEGRIVEMIYNTSGAKVSWAVIYDLMGEQHGIRQYQFRQIEDRLYRLYLIVQAPLHDREESALKQGFRRLLGDDAVLELHYTEVIEAFPSGKRPMILNEMSRASRSGMDAQV
jgi:phenylacetate-CoA ligase